MHVPKILSSGDETLFNWNKKINSKTESNSKDSKPKPNEIVDKKPEEGEIMEQVSENDKLATARRYEDCQKRHPNKMMQEGVHLNAKLCGFGNEN